MNNTKLTKLEKCWILYDVGNSAFIMLVSTIIPIYFNFLAGNAGISEVDYLAYWGYAASVATTSFPFFLICSIVSGPFPDEPLLPPQPARLVTTIVPTNIAASNFFTFLINASVSA